MERKMQILSLEWWLTPVILATLEVERRRIAVRGHSGKSL
jgi:hypothetical protein